MSAMRRSLPPGGLAGAVLAVLLFADSAGAVVSHLSHRAFYEIRIGRIDSGSEIVDARGRMAVEWRRVCKGWSSKQRIMIRMGTGEGAPVDLELVLRSFEALDGSLYSFDSRTRVGGEIVEAVEGTARRGGPGKPGLAEYRMPRGVTVDLPADTVFPFEHTIAVLETAERGGSRAFSHYFDGLRPEISPMTANSLVLGRARPGAAGTGNGFGAMSGGKWWPVRLAMFAAGTGARRGAAPEFEMTQILQDNGVVRRFEFDYEEFSLVASLVELAEIAPPSCG